MIEQKRMLSVVNENFERYAGNVILDRAICDARDMLKPSARMLIYSQLHESKNIPSKPFIKSARIVGDCLGHYYEHGDQSCYGTYMRMAKPFSMRVPLEDCQGNSGTLITTGDEASMRYTELRLAQISQYLYGGIEKNAIGEEWKTNFDETEQYPGVMPSIGYYNLCNGTIGLGIAISSSIPQFNLKEVNSSIIKLINNSEASDSDIIIMPDFATGATLINKNEVYQSLIDGTGKACKLRAKIEYIPDGNYLHISELPYSVFTETITNELKALLEENERYGIESINDGTGKTPDYNIYLSKGVNPQKMIKKLYKDTSLESHFTINMWVLDEGRYPKIMGLRGLFNSYIAHIRKCKKNEINFDLEKAYNRLNIVDGLLTAVANIDEIVSLIKNSKSPTDAAIALNNRFNFNEEQTKAILSMKLSSLTRMDGIKLENEKEELINKIKKLSFLLNNSRALDEELIKILEEVSEKFGDARRTKVMNLSESEDIEPVMEQNLAVMLFDNNMFRIVLADEMNGAKRGRKGVNLRPPKGSNLINTLYTTNLGTVSCFSSEGKMYTFSLGEYECGIDYSLYEAINIQNDSEIIIKIIDGTSFLNYKNIVFVTKNGLIKKTETKEYNIKSKKGAIAIKLKDDDSIVNVYLSSNDEDKIMIASDSGNYVMFNVGNVNSIGRVASGVKAISLKKNARVISTTMIRKNLNYHGILTIASNGKGKITKLEDFSETSRAIQGPLAHKIDKSEMLSVVYAIETTKDRLSVMANNKLVSLRVDEIPIQTKLTSGVQIIKIDNGINKIEVK